MGLFLSYALHDVGQSSLPMVLRDARQRLHGQIGSVNISLSEVVWVYLHIRMSIPYLVPDRTCKFARLFYIPFHVLTSRILNFIVLLMLLPLVNYLARGHSLYLLGKCSLVLLDHNIAFFIDLVIGKLFDLLALDCLMRTQTLGFDGPLTAFWILLMLRLNLTAVFVRTWFRRIHFLVLIRVLLDYPLQMRRHIKLWKISIKREMNLFVFNFAAFLGMLRRQGKFTTTS